MMDKQCLYERAKTNDKVLTGQIPIKETNITVNNATSFDELLSALISNCAILYTEDLQHNQMIESKLKILNPFKK